MQQPFSWPSCNFLRDVPLAGNRMITGAEGELAPTCGILVPVTSMACQAFAYFKSMMLTRSSVEANQALTETVDFLMVLFAGPTTACCSLSFWKYSASGTPANAPDSLIS